MSSQKANPLQSEFIHQEQLRQLYASMPSAFIANIATSCLLVLAQWPVIDHSTLVIWLTCSVVIILLRLLTYIRYNRRTESPLKTQTWSLLFDIGSSSSAAMLGLAAIFLFPANNPLHQLICAFVLTGMSAGAVSTLSAGKYTFPLYISFAMFPLIISYLIEATQLSYIIVTMLILAYSFILKSNRNIYHRITENIAYRIEANEREQSLLDAQQKQILHTLNTSLAVIEWTSNFKVTEWNPAAEKIFGYSKEQALGAHGLDLIIPDNLKPEAELQWEKISTQTINEEIIYQNITANGDIITCEWHNTPLINPDNEIIGIISTAQDITARTKDQAELKETQTMLQLVLNTIPARVFWKDLNNVYLGCNDKFSNDAGLNEPNDIIGHNDFEMPWKEQAQSYQDDDNDVMHNDKPRIAYEEPQTQHNGKTIWVETSKIPLKDQQGNVYGVLGTYHDITERKQAINEIINAKDAAEKANAAKSEFLSRMSHELRTPLNAILGFGQILQMSSDNSEEQKKVHLNHIVTAGKHLLNLINEVLDISRIDSGEMQLKLESIDINLLIEDVLSLVEPLTSKNNIDINFTPSLQNITLLTDRTRLTQVFINIITNAIKYNQENGAVAIKTSFINEQQCQVHIKDTGIGIKPEDQSFIFQPFYRSSETQYQEEGSGIGLTVTQKLLELLNSDINFESTYGEGTEFILDLSSISETSEN